MLSPRPLSITSALIFFLLIAIPYFLFFFMISTIGPTGIPFVHSPFSLGHRIAGAFGRNDTIFLFSLLGVIAVAWFIGMTIGFLGYARALKSGIDKRASLIAPLLYVVFVLFLILRRV